MNEKDTDMKHTLQLNTTLITSLGHVLGKTNAELMEAAGVSNATWYRIMGHPDEITVQQLISIANGLCIPVFRFFSIDGVNVIGNKEDYIENPYKPCYYDAEALQALISTRSAATWQDVANSLGITRTNLRNSLLSYTRLPLARFLATCNAFDIEPFLVIVDPNTHRESNGLRSDMLVPFFTSQNDTSIPLPRGLSGWVNTAVTSNLFFSRASSDALAKSGVPINTIRIIHRPHFSLILHPSACAHTFQGTDGR